ncbi:NAD-dependent epimerase/dehydratase family protein [Photobacterium leiognathi]|uniref:NAD-dependent epimerase/dehydratase family protein n=1 Tax=Photobacterium leiognathi TaxID=553611 RepID=UPI002982562B|nr:NAD(P)-dependent oxidoreductase [Photobacterium leiognathi]
MKKILITGCNGLLGQRFIELHYKDYHITALSRSPIASPKLRVNYCVSDYSCDSLVPMFSRQDAVIHLAATRLYKGKDCYQVNTTLDSEVFKAAEMASVPHLIFASTRGVYGGKGPWQEEDAISPHNPYAFGKAQSELSALYYTRIKGQTITILRLAQILSDQEYEGGMLRTFFDRAERGLPLHLTAADISREYLYIDDAVDAFKAVIDSDGPAGIYNLGSGESVTIESITQIIADTYGVTVQKSPELKSMDEFSLMDSSTFRNTFNWTPNFTFELAVKDIVQKRKYDDR